MEYEGDRLIEVMVTDSIGLIRGLGRHGIPIILLGSKQGSIVRYSKYITKRLACPDPNTQEAESEFVKFLLEYGKQAKKKIKGTRRGLPSSRALRSKFCIRGTYRPSILCFFAS